MGTNYRAIFGILIEIPFALGGVLVALVSWAGVRVSRTELQSRESDMIWLEKKKQISGDFYLENSDSKQKFQLSYY